jgi:transposase
MKQATSGAAIRLEDVVVFEGSQDAAVRGARLGDPSGAVVCGHAGRSGHRRRLDSGRRGRLAILVARLGGDGVLACLEMMSGAAWVRERLTAGGWSVQIADARKAKAVGSLAAETDTLDARVLAELARRDLVPQVHVPTFADRELKERRGRRMHMVRLRTSAMNRAHGILSQFGVKLAFDRLRQGDREELLIQARRSRRLAPLDRRGRRHRRRARPRLIPIEAELRRWHARTRESRCWSRSPGIGDLLGLTIAELVADERLLPELGWRRERRLFGQSGGRRSCMRRSADRP